MVQLSPIKYGGSVVPGQAGTCPATMISIGSSILQGGNVLHLMKRNHFVADGPTSMTIRINTLSANKL